MGGGGYSHLKRVCRPRLKLKKGAYGADQTEKVVPLELIGCIQKKWVLLELIELKKMMHSELIKLKKGDITAAHTRTALIWEYPLREIDMWRTLCKNIVVQSEHRKDHKNCLSYEYLAYYFH